MLDYTPHSNIDDEIDELSKVEKIELLRRMEEEQLRFYCPHLSQEEFHKAMQSVRALFWSNQEGKSYCGCLDIAWTLSRSHPFRPNDMDIIGPLHARDCCKTNKVLHGTLIPTYQKLLPRKPCILSPVYYDDWHPKAGQLAYDRTFEGHERRWPGLDGGSWRSAWNKELNKLYLADGSFIEFNTYDQDVETYSGSQMHIIRMDEEPPQGVYGENQARQIGLGRVNILFTMTPLKYSPWIYGLFQQSASDPDIYASQKRTRENPQANAKVLAFIEKNVVNEAEKAARLYGEFAYETGRIWKDYGDHNLCEPFQVPRGWRVSRVIDPHLEKATAVLWFAQSPEGILYVIAEAEYSDDVLGICQKVAVKEAEWHIDLELMDPSARQSTSIHGKGRLIDEFRKYLPNIIEANNNREVGWNTVGNLVKDKGTQTKLRVSKACPKTHLQMKNYSWKAPLKSGESRGTAQPMKIHDEFPDCVRYRAMAGLSQTDIEDFEGFQIGVYGNG